jgi:hypothetical protein
MLHAVYRCGVATTVTSALLRAAATVAIPAEQDNSVRIRYQGISALTDRAV